jgi:hypothetical protein
MIRLQQWESGPHFAIEHLRQTGCYAHNGLKPRAAFPSAKRPERFAVGKVRVFVYPQGFRQIRDGAERQDR